MPLISSCSPTGMVITDLDGTLLRSDRTFSPTNLATLQYLQERQIVRVIATGRSLFSLRKVIPEHFPIDYIIFSSGAGIIDWRTQKLLVAHHLCMQEVVTALNVLIEQHVDFMLHHPIPDNHHFWYYTTGRENPDFTRRYELYRDFATPFDLLSMQVPEKACQFVAIVSCPEALSRYTLLCDQLPGLKVIRATSPLDSSSIWIEIFPRSVSKALASAWLADQFRLPYSEILALGNDYNDLDLLQWATHSLVVINAPADLKSLYPTVRSNDQDGFTQAVEIWMNH
ncbi:MAG: HAD family hydrolase [Candidatus Vecturithrix sp.]|nr:HAD family hydrolase [Candidatus Vecturithrix sp.]